MPSQIASGSIVVGIDGSDDAALALEHAAAQAVLERRPLTLLTAVSPMVAVPADPGGFRSVVDVEDLTASGREVLREARAEAEKLAPGAEIHEVFVLEDPRAALLEATRHASTVVVGSRGRGAVARLLLGSVSSAVSRHAACPVVVARPRPRGGAARGVLVGADATESSQPTLEHAFRQASLRRLPLTVVHAFWDARTPVFLAGEIPAGIEETRVALAESMAGLREKYPDVEVHTEFARGQADEALVALSREADLLVVGAHHGNRLSAFVFGSVATVVVEHAACPVVVVPVR